MAHLKIIRAIYETLDQNTFCNIMLTGGHAAGRLYEVMRKSSSLPMSRMNFFWGDERCVPPSSIESNFGLAKSSIFDKSSDRANFIARIKGEALNYDDEAKRYSLLLPEKIDILILGVGNDGHVASLFPGHPAVNEWSKLAVAIPPDENRGPRISVTPKVIRDSKKIFVLAPGANKGAVLAKSLRAPKEYANLPARLTLGGYWLLDEESVQDFLNQWEDLKKSYPHTRINLNGIII